MHIVSRCLLTIVCVFVSHGTTAFSCRKPKFVDSDNVQPNSSTFNKCCPFGAYFDGRGCEQRANLTFEVTVFNSSGFDYVESAKERFVIGLPECYMYPFEPHLFRVRQNGTLYIPFDKRRVARSEYCLEVSQENVITAFICRPYTECLLDKLSAIGLMISLPSLLATSLVYICLPERSLHIKIHVCYLMSLAVATAVLVYFQFEYTIKIRCIIFGYMEYYFSVAAFYWLNVICINMWRTFSEDFADSRLQKNQTKLFMLYNLYGWGVPLLQLILVVIFDLFTDVDSVFHPGLIEGYCYFITYYGMLIYCQIPMGILLVINTILFVRTAIRIKRVNAESFNKTGSQRHQKATQGKSVHIYVKVVVTTGVNWILDFVLWMIYLLWKTPTYHEEYIWHFIKLHCAGYGISLFFIFICRKRTLHALKMGTLKRDTSSRRVFQSS